MAKMRSPNYPSIGLKEALEKVKLVYKEEHTHPVSRDVIAKDLGYNSLNGASLPVIGSLKRYALMEDVGEGMRVTADAVSIIELPEGEPEKTAALQRVAFAPSFFKEIRNEFGEKLPSDGNLKHYLIKKKFLPKAADEVVRIYRDNLKLAGVSENGYTDEVAETKQNESKQEQQPVVYPKPGSPSVSVSVRQDVFSLAEGPVTIQWPASISTESFQDLGDWLEILKRKIGRSVKTAEQE